MKILPWLHVREPVHAADFLKKVSSVLVFETRRYSFAEESQGSLPGDEIARPIDGVRWEKLERIKLPLARDRLSAYIVCTRPSPSHRVCTFISRLKSKMGVRMSACKLNFPFARVRCAVHTGGRRDGTVPDLVRYTSFSSEIYTHVSSRRSVNDPPRSLIVRWHCAINHLQVGGCVKTLDLVRERFCFFTFENE